MCRLKLTENGFVNFLVLVGMLVIAISLSIATKLVQQNQENRSNAASAICKSGERRCIDNGIRCVKTPCYSFDTQTCVNGAWKKSGTCSSDCTKDGVCKKNTPTPTPTKKPECKTGDKRCVDNGIRCRCRIDGKTKCVEIDCPSFDTQTCVNGVWKKSGTCSSNCTKDGVCKKNTPTPTKAAECKDGERTCMVARCAVGSKEPCNEIPYPVAFNCSNGSWKKGETCTYGCKNGVCLKKPTPTPTKKPECTAGDKRCVDNGIRCIKAPCYSFDTQTCVNGVWKKSGTCSSDCTKDGVCKKNKPVLNSKIAFYGIKAGTNINCISSLNSVSLEVVDITNNKLQTFSNIPITLAVGESNSAGDQIFQINNLNLDASIFKNSNTFLYIKIKGTNHLKQKMCINNQTKKIDNNNGCNINLYNENIYNFSNYPLLPGDVNQDGIINGIDFSLIKNDINTHDSSICGNKTDLNLDGFTNSIDLNLIKTTLSARSDE